MGALAEGRHQACPYTQLVQPRLCRATYSPMTIDEKVRKTLAELGVSDAVGVETLFAEVRAAMAAERSNLVSHGAPSEPERDKLCKDLRDRWLARKNGLLSLADENWLKTSPKELKPAVGKSFNSLRHESAALEVAALTQRCSRSGADCRP